MEIGIDLGDNYGLPDDDHISVMFRAVNDTVDQEAEGVTGVENFTLAQHYAIGVLSNYTPGRIDGVESIFSSIGDGLKKAWEYIVNMVKRIWGFFFSKDGEKKAKEVEEKVEKETKVVEAAVSGKLTEPEYDKILDKMGKTDPEVAEVVKEVKDKPLSEKRAKIKEAMELIAKKQPGRFVSLKHAGAQMTKWNESFQTGYAKILESSKGVITTDQQRAIADRMATRMEKFERDIANANGAIKAFIDNPASNIGKVEIMIGQMKKAISANSQLIKDFTAEKNAVTSEVRRLDAELKAGGGSKGIAEAAEARDKLKEEINGLREIIRMSAAIAKLSEDNLRIVRIISVQLSKAFAMDI